MNNFPINRLAAVAIVTFAMQPSADAQSRQFQHWTSGRANEACYIANQASIPSGTLTVFIADFSGGDGRQVQIQASIPIDEAVRPVIIVDGVSYQATRVVRDGEGDDFARFSPADTTRIVAAMRAGNQMTVRVYSNQREYNANMSLAGVTAATNHMERSCSGSSARSSTARQNASANSRSTNSTGAGSREVSSRTILDESLGNQWSCQISFPSTRSGRNGARLPFSMNINSTTNIVISTEPENSFMLPNSSSSQVCGRHTDYFSRRDDGSWRYRTDIEGRCQLNSEFLLVEFNEAIFDRSSADDWRRRGRMATTIIGRLQADGTLLISGSTGLSGNMQFSNGVCERG